MREPCVQAGEIATLNANSTLTKGLASDAVKKGPKVVVRPHDFGASDPSIEFDRLNQLIEDMEVEEYLRKTKASAPLNYVSTSVKVPDSKS